MKRQSSVSNVSGSPPQLVKEEMLATLACHSPAGLFGADPGGVCVYLNAKAEAICGVTQAGSVGKAWAEAFKIDAAENIMASWLAGGMAGYKGVFRICSGGTQRWIELQTSPIHAGESECAGHAGVILETMAASEIKRRIGARDAITDILADSTSIEGSQERILAGLGAILGWHFGVLWQLDKQANALRAPAVWAASPAPAFEAATRQKTFAPDVGLPGRVWSSRQPAWIADLGVDPNFPRARAALEAGLHGAFAFPILLGDEIFGVIEFFCQEVWGPDPDLLQMVGAIGSQIGQFVSRKRKEADLRQTELRLQLLARHVGEVLWVADPTEGRFTYLSPSFEAIWGRRAENGLRRDVFLETVHPNDRDRATTFLECFCAGKETEEEFRILRPDGTIRWIRDLAFPVRNGNGLLEHVVGLAVDITARREHEQERARAAKAEAIAVLASGLAHDLNNILTAVMGNASLALEMRGEGRALESCLHTVLSSTQRAATVVAQILAYAGRGRFINAQIDLSKLADELVEEIRRSLPQNVYVAKDLMAGMPLIQGDPNQIRQLIGNLCLNAIEAVGDRPGTVTISTGTEQLGGIGSPGTAPCQYVWLKVTDTGCGIDEQIRERIFDPFFTTKFIGRGLGLAAAQGIVKSHGGMIRVSSQLGRGSVFTCLLPVKDLTKESQA